GTSLAAQITASDDRNSEQSEQARPTRNQARHILELQHDTFSSPEWLRPIVANARAVPSKTPNGFVTALRSKPPIVVGRRRSVSASDNARDA
ncbi:MAG: hypothetical protein WCE62_15410, partial [Polyangiales bacterium]